jgi:hypothetical protein
LIGVHVLEIGLISAIYVVGLLVAGLSYRVLNSRAQAMLHPTRRVLQAMYRATQAALSRSVRSNLGTLCVLVALCAAVRLLVPPLNSTTNGAYMVGLSILAGLLGALSATAVAEAAARWTEFSASRAATAAASDLDGLLVTVMRSSLTLALLVEGFSFAACAGAFGLLWMLGAGIPTTHESPMTALAAAVQILPQFAIGALLMSISIQHTGTTYRSAVQTGGEAANADADLVEMDPRNPAAIAELTSVQFGQLVPHVLEGFCSALCANSLIVVVLWRIAPDVQSISQHEYLLMPLVIRAFGSLSCIFAAGAARTLESVNPISALWRSYAVALAIAVGAMCGMAIWLAPDESTRVAVCGVLGIFVPALVGCWQYWIIKSTNHSGRGSRRTADTGWNQGLTAGLWGVAVPLVLLGATAIGVEHIGAASRLPNGRLFSLMVCLLAAGITVPFQLTLQSACSTVIIARRAILLARDVGDDSQRRLARLESATKAATVFCGSSATFCTIGLALITASAIAALAQAPKGSTFSSGTIAVIAVGAIAFAAPIASGLRASARTSRALVREVRRQFGGFPRTSGRACLPAEFTPSYRHCVEIATREASRHVSIPVVAVLVPTPALCLSLSWVTKSPGLVGQALALYLGLVSVAAFAAAFILDVAYGFASALRVQVSPDPPLPTAHGGCSAVHFLAAHGTVATRLIPKFAVVAALAFTPYLF